MAQYSISHDRAEETEEAKDRWFRSLTPAQRIAMFSEFYQLAAAMNPHLGEEVDVPPAPTRIRVLRKP